MPILNVNFNVLYEYHPTKNPIDTHTHTHHSKKSSQVLVKHNTMPPLQHPSPPPHRKRHPKKNNNNCDRHDAGPASSKSSSVKRRFCAVASCLFKAYSAQTRWESTNSASHVCTWWNPLGWQEPGVGVAWNPAGWLRLSWFYWLKVVFCRGGSKQQYLWFLWMDWIDSEWFWSIWAFFSDQKTFEGCFSDWICEVDFSFDTRVARCITEAWTHLKEKLYHCLVIQSDLFGMVKWPFQGVKWPPTIGDEKGTLNHLVLVFWWFSCW